MQGTILGRTAATSPIAPPAPDSTQDGEEGSTAPVAEVPDWVPASFADLYRNNPDVRGYIQVPGTRMNYPVTQAADNEYYLNRNFYKRRSVSPIPISITATKSTAPTAT